MSNVLVWADIPVLDLDRASKFYAHATGGPVLPMEDMEGIALIMGSEPGGPDGDTMTVSADLYVGTPSVDGPSGVAPSAERIWRPWWSNDSATEESCAGLWQRTVISATSETA